MTVYNVASHTQPTYEDMRDYIRPQHLAEVFQDSVFSEDVQSLLHKGRSLAKRLTPSDMDVD